MKRRRSPPTQPAAILSRGKVSPASLRLGSRRRPWGATGVAEMPFMTYAPAVVAALHDATGVWFDTFPLTPDRVLAGLR